MNNLKYFFTHESELPEGLGYSFFDVTHFSWMILSLLVVAVIVFIYTKIKYGNRRWIMLTAAVCLVLCEVLRNIWFISIGKYTLMDSLPLQLSRILVFVEAAAIIFGKRYLREFTYACGLFSVAAFIAPDIMAYPLVHIHTIRYTIAHILLLAVPLMWIAGDGFRPDIRYLPKCAALLVGIAVVAETLNIFLGSNYLHIHYIPTHVNLNLRQPFFAMAFVGAVLGFWVVIYLPWIVYEKIKRH